MTTIVRDGVPFEISGAEAAAFDADRPVVAVPVPTSISRRQFLLALMGAGFISPSEAISAATSGALPAAVSALFSDLPPTEATGAIITWASMTTAERGDPLIQMLVNAGLATAAEVDDLFRVGATL
jgi:hypothetical protein